MPPISIVTSVRSLNRLRQIARVLTKHGFGHVVERLNIGRFVPIGKLIHVDRKTGPGTPAASLGRRFAAVCAELGPTFVKLGQTISTRPDLAPPEVMDELRLLQDRVPPFKWEKAREIIECEIDGPLETAFAAFCAEPFASGSIAQVYEARTHHGEEVVVKVKRPDIDEVIRLDLHLLQWLAYAMEEFTPELARFNPRQIIEEFEQLLMRELDLVWEATATSRFEQAFANDDYITIPRVHWELTGSCMLTLSRIHGEKLERALGDESSRFDRKLLAERLVKSYLKQFFDVHRFHADPHPGNFLIRPPAEIGLIDFGQVGILSDEVAGQLVTIIIGLIYREPQVIVDVLSDMGAVSPQTDAAALTRTLRNLLDKYHGQPLHRLDVTSMFYELTAAIRDHKASLPRELVMVLKTLVTVFGVALSLDPKLDLVSLITPRIRGLILDRFSPKRIGRTAVVTAWHLGAILKAAPAQIRNIMRHINRGSFQVNIRHENLDRLANEIDRSSNRLAFSIVIAAVIVGSSVVISTRTDSNIFGIPVHWIGIGGYVVAGVLGISLVWAILRSGRLS